MALTKLSVVNKMLGGLGELPVNSLSEGHPLVPAALADLANVNTREQTKGWWFNRELVELSPDTAGYIFLPNDALAVDPTVHSNHYVMRGRKLYKPYEKTVATKYKFTTPVDVVLIREVPFEDLPTSAQNLVMAAARYEFALDRNPDTNALTRLRQLYGEALVAIGQENISAADNNILQRRGLDNERSEAGSVFRPSSVYRPHS